MTDFEEEIEFLDEDADIVQQCVIPVNIPVIPKGPSKSLLTERKRVPNKRPKAESDDDKDYDPSKDPDFNHFLRKKPQSNVYKRPIRMVNPSTSQEHVEKMMLSKFQPTKTYEVKSTNQVGMLKRTFAHIEAKPKPVVRIFDYQDPICMQDGPITNASEEYKTSIKEWNKLCVEQMTKYEEPLIPDDIKFSQRTVVLRNVRNKLTGKSQSSVYSQLTVQSEEGLKITEAFQSVLPNFQNKRNLNSDIHADAILDKRSNAVKSCVLLTKEEHKDGNVLVAYKPADCTASMYELVEKSEDEGDKDSEISTYLEEKVRSKVCSVCYQYSWRGGKVKSKKVIVKCPICDRVCSNTHNLLLHMKAHRAGDIKGHKEKIDKVLSEMVYYHYMCRICQSKMSTVKELRKHINEHKGSKTFLCEVGNHCTR